LQYATVQLTTREPSSYPLLEPPRILPVNISFFESHITLTLSESRCFTSLNHNVSLVSQSIHCHQSISKRRTPLALRLSCTVVWYSPVLLSSYHSKLVSRATAVKDSPLVQSNLSRYAPSFPPLLHACRQHTRLPFPAYGANGPAQNTLLISRTTRLCPATSCAPSFVHPSPTLLLHTRRTQVRPSSAYCPNLNLPPHLQSLLNALSVSVVTSRDLPSFVACVIRRY
jgi:hypothetical protein